MKKNRSLEFIEVSVVELFKEFWKFKFLILFICSSISILVYVFFNIYSAKNYSLKVHITEVEPKVFIKYKEILDNVNLNTFQSNKEILSLTENFNDHFISDLSSSYNLTNFINLKIASNNLEVYHDGTNYSEKDFRKISINNTESTINKKKLYSNTYRFDITLNQFINPNFFYDYVDFTKNIFLEKSKKTIVENINSLITIHKFYLEAAILSNLYQRNNNEINIPYGGPWLDARVIRLQINRLEEFVKQVNSNSLVFEHTPIVYSEISRKDIEGKKKPIIIGFSAFIITMLFSLVTLITRVVYRK